MVKAELKPHGMLPVQKIDAPMSVTSPRWGRQDVQTLPSRSITDSVNRAAVLVVELTKILHKMGRIF